MDDAISLESFVPQIVLQPLLVASKSSTLDKALERLIEIARATDGRSDLASKNILTTVLQLCKSISYPSRHHLLLLSLRLLRNLCAGEISSQKSFIEQNGVGIVSAIFNSVKLGSTSKLEIVRIGLQVLRNVSLAGDEHQRAVWHHLFTLDFIELARVRSRRTCDPLCMIIYTCCEGNHGLIADLCSDKGLPIVAEIIRTASAKILNERVSDITVSDDFALWILGIFRKAAGIVDSSSKGKLGIPTGLTDIDVLGYSLTILRDICACGSLGGFKEDDYVDVVDSLLSSGLLELLLDLLQDLEPPEIIRKATKHDEFEEGTSSFFSKLCPYKGFRSDLVAVIGNYAYQRKHVQDWIRQKNKIMVLLQQCVTDEDNPFLREWGIWSVRNLLEGN